MTETFTLYPRDLNQKLTSHFSRDIVTPQGEDHRPLVNPHRAYAPKDTLRRACTSPTSHVIHHITTIKRACHRRLPERFPYTELVVDETTPRRALEMPRRAGTATLRRVDAEAHRRTRGRRVSAGLLAGVRDAGPREAADVARE